MGLLYDESCLVRERVNNVMVTEAQLAQRGVAGILSDKARKAFTEMVKSLNVRTKPIRRLFE